MSDLQLTTYPKRTVPNTIASDDGLRSVYDGSFWNNLNTSFDGICSAPMSGYEGFSIKYNADSLSGTTYQYFEFFDGDDEFRSYSTLKYFIPTYNTIKLKETPNNMTRIRDSFIPYLTGFDLSGNAVVTTIGDISGTVDIFERCPTTMAYASTYSDNGESLYSSNRIVWSYEPAIVTFTDSSVARTFPISAWFIDFGDSTSDSYTVTSGNYHPSNKIVTHDNLFSKTYTRANTYYATLYTEASTTATKSIDLTTLSNELTCRVDVYPIRQTNNFFLISGESVGSTYTANDPISISSVSTYNGTFISGYAPNLTVTFQESATPYSFPIGEYLWDFGDVFRSSNTYEYVSATDVQTGFGNGWITDKTNHYTTYTYMFPGLYTVSLSTSVSASDSYQPAFTYPLSTELCAREILVYVQEITPDVIFDVSTTLVSGFASALPIMTNPMTVYFNASSTIPGSFPIGRVVWDFGDGTKQTILSSYSIPYPQNYIVNHEYARTLVADQSAFNVTLSAYAYNTDTVGTYTINNLVTLSSINPDGFDIDYPKHLLATSYVNDELLMVFESNNKTTFNYVLSTGDL